jgi:hypothetical protein
VAERSRLEVRYTRGCSSWCAAVTPTPRPPCDQPSGFPASSPHLHSTRVRAFLLQILVRMGDTEGAEHVLADQDREAGETRRLLAPLPPRK